MHIHEYQAKQILSQYGIPVPPYAIAESADEAKAAATRLGLSQAVLKVQIHAGGRGKAGGVKVATTPQQINEYSQQLLGMKIVNNQTGPEGIIARQILISSLVQIQKEYYLAAAIDRQKAQGVIIASPEGGMDIEEIAAHAPHRILVMPIRQNGLLHNYELLEIIKFMEWEGVAAEQGKKIISSLAKAFVETDAMLIEINPLVKTTNGALIALDAKLTIDENALYRQPQIAAFYDPTQITSYEARAKKYDLAYVALDGDIGCIVNGAGLAMATMDIIHYYGGRPANFLDIGGGASQEKVAEGVRIILSDSKVKAILINIFGGIMNCVTLAAGLVAAVTEQALYVPLIVRMEGTNVEKGRHILADSGLDIIVADTLDDAAQKAVEAAKARTKNSG